MQKLCFIQLLFFFFLLQNSCFAGQPWSMKACIDYALNSNLELQVEEAGIEYAKQAVIYQKRMFFPSLELGMSSGYLDGESTTAFSVVNKFTEEEGIKSTNKSGYYFTGDVTLEVPLVRQGTFIGGTTPAQKEATSELAVSSIELELKRKDVSHEVGLAYLNLLKSKQALNLANDHLKSLNLYYRAATAKFQEEMISKNDLLIADVNLAIGQNEWELAQNLLKLSSSDLKITMGFPEDEELVIDDKTLAPPPLPGIDLLIQEALKNSLALQKQQQMAISASEARLLAKKDRYPKLELLTVYSAAYDFDENPVDLWKSYLNLSFPLFDRGLSRTKVKMQDALVKENEKLWQSLSNQVKKEVLMVYTEAMNAVANQKLEEKRVEQAMENVRLMRARFKLELTDLSHVLEAEYTLQTFEKNRNEATFNILSALWKLQNVTGVNLFFSSPNE